MKITVTDSGENKKLVEITFPWEEIEDEYELGLRETRKEYQMPGFRKGKVPLSLIRRQFGKSLLINILRDRVKNNYDKIIKENKLNVLDVLDLVPDRAEEGQECRLVLSIEVEPEFELWDYKQGFEVEKVEYITGESDVERSLQDLRERNAEKRIVKDGAKEGHFLLVNMQEVDSAGTPLIGRRVERRLIKLGEGYFSGEVLETLEGIKAGETRRIELDEGEETYYFDITVLTVEEHVLPEVNEEFIKKVDPEASSIEEFKQHIKESIDRQLAESAEQDFEKAIVDFLVSKHDFDVPESLIETYLETIVEEEKNRSGEELDLEVVRKKHRPDAIFAAKWYLISSRIIENEKLEVSEDEVQAYIQEEIDRADEKVKDFFRDFYNAPKQKSKIRNEIENRKLLEHLKQYVKPKIRKIKTEDLLVE